MIKCLVSILVCLTAIQGDGSVLQPHTIIPVEFDILSQMFSAQEQRQIPTPEALQRKHNSSDPGEISPRQTGERIIEPAIDDALEWLAAHQRPDGIWDRRHFDKLCPPNDRCSQTSLERTEKNADVGVSALAALAFLSVGYTHQEGKYAHQLSQVFSYILAQQNAAGSFASGSGLQMFDDAIATLAIAEAYVQTKDNVLLQPLRKAVHHLERAQQGAGGWTYTDNRKQHRNDTSITGWVVMALKSAQAAGVSASLETRFRIIDHFDWATEPDGRVRHSNKGAGATKNPKSGKPNYRYGPAMTAVGLYVRDALGFRLDDSIAMKQSQLLMADLPSIKRLRGGDPSGLHSEYSWYFGTMALFHVEGVARGKWRHALRSAVLEYQERHVDRKGRRRHTFGSWPAYGPGWGRWGRTGGRIYSTAINTLTLAIYYGHVPAYLSTRSLLGTAELRQQWIRHPPGDKESMLKLVLRMHPDTSEPLLLDLIHSSKRKVRLSAALALADLGSPMGRGVLLRYQKQAKPKKRRSIDKALRKISSIRTAQSYGRVTTINSQARMLLFDTDRQPLYYGQRISIIREGQPIGIATINRRFTHDKAAAAMIVEGAGRIRKGDQVISLIDE